MENLRFRGVEGSREVRGSYFRWVALLGWLEQEAVVAGWNVRQLKAALGIGERCETAEFAHRAFIDGCG